VDEEPEDEDLSADSDKWVDLSADEFAVPEEFFAGELSGPDAPVFDAGGAIERFMGQREIVIRVASQFAEKGRATIQELRTFLDNGAYEDLQREAHGLKGGAWNLEARRVGDVAAELEGSAKMKDRKRCEHFLELLGPEVEHLARAVEGFSSAPVE